MRTAVSACMPLRQPDSSLMGRQSTTMQLEVKLIDMYRVRLLTFFYYKVRADHMIKRAIDGRTVGPMMGLLHNPRPAPDNR